MQIRFTKKNKKKSIISEQTHTAHSDSFAFCYIEYVKQIWIDKRAKHQYAEHDESII